MYSLNNMKHIYTESKKTSLVKEHKPYQYRIAINESIFLTFPRNNIGSLLAFEQKSDIGQTQARFIKYTALV